MKGEEKVNIKHLKSYLKVLYNVNNRRMNSPYAYKSKKSNRLVSQFFLNLFLGFPLLLIFTVVNNFSVALFATFTIMMLLLISIFIMEYSMVLFDPNDNNILSYRPINDRTVFLGRVIYIALYAFVFGMAVALIPLIYLLIVKGAIVFLTYLLATLTTILFSVFFSLFLYMILMRWLGGEKLNKFIFIFQMVISMGIIFLSNLGGEYLKPMNYGEANLYADYWGLLYPPAWEVAIVDMLSWGKYSVMNIIFSCMAVVFPTLLGAVSYRYLAKSFKKEILKFDVKTEKKRSKLKFSFANIFASLFTRTRAESSVFKTIYKILHRDKAFMMSVFASFAIMVVVFGMNMFKNLSRDGSMHRLGETSLFILFCYLASMVFLTVSQKYTIGNFISVSDRYKAAPIAEPGIVKVMTIKVLNCKFLIPVLIVVSIAIIPIWGWLKILDVIASFFMVNVIAGLIIFSGKSVFPLSLNKAEGEKVGVTFGGMGLLLVAGFMHYGLSKVPFGVLGYTVLAGLFYFLFMRKYRKLKWRDFI